MSAAMFRGREVVRRVVVAAWGYLGGDHFRVKGFAVGQ